MNLEQLADKVNHLEQEVTLIRKELVNLREERKAVETTVAPQSIPKVSFVDKALLSKAMDELFKTLGIEGEPIGVEALRRMMQAENLAPNELSRGIIEARDE